MNSALRLQKAQMQAAINWLTIIETCDVHISAGNDVMYYMEKKEKAVKGYAEAMTAVVNSAIDISNVEFFELVKVA